MWTRHKQQQQRGVQFRPQSGAAPEEAVKDRSAQDHEHAVVAVSPPGEPDSGEPQPGSYPASRMQDGDSDNTPSAPEPTVDWDEVVQPEQQQGKNRKPSSDDFPLPEGK